MITSSISSFMSTPSTWAVSLSWLTARMARPVSVLFRKTSKRNITPQATPKAMIPFYAGLGVVSLLMLVGSRLSRRRLGRIATALQEKKGR